jgi:prepilin-type N-terminal cleavage/methylation domain-containing protein/prepilin-type processing-associated H-X9-DG protein
MRKQNGFTLIELLVVIAIIALLLGVLVPALNYAKVQATAIICMSNLDGLTMGWVLYNEDNDQKVMGSRPHGANARSVEYYPAYPRGSATREVWNFVGNPHDENGNDGNHGIEYAARGFRNGALWPYVESEKIFHCQSDKRYLKEPTKEAGHWANSTRGGYRSYSLGGVWNVDPSGGWDTGEERAVVYQMDEVVSPSHKMVFLEEYDSCGMNHNTFNFFLNTRSKWGDPFSVAHNNRSCFGFADGHAEKHEWKEESTRKMSEEGRKEYPLSPGEYQDIDWFREHYVPGKMPAAFRNV